MAGERVVPAQDIASPGTLPVSLAGTTLHLLPQRALWWPDQRALMVADVHLGKGQCFRRLGIAVPAGSTERDLQRLSLLTRRYRPCRLWVLGDLFHAAPEPRLAAVFEAWRRAAPDQPMTLIRGNHDRGIVPPPSWRLELYTSANLGGITLAHEPDATCEGWQIVGHVHPAIRIRQGRHDSLRASAFWQRKKQLCLPAFGSFTGGFNIRQQPGDRVFAVGPEAVVELGVSASMVPP